jgi:hypothetical protein
MNHLDDLFSDLIGLQNYKNELLEQLLRGQTMHNDILDNLVVVLNENLNSKLFSKSSPREYNSDDDSDSDEEDSLNHPNKLSKTIITGIFGKNLILFQGKNITDIIKSSITEEDKNAGVTKEFLKEINILNDVMKIIRNRFFPPRQVLLKFHIDDYKKSEELRNISNKISLKISIVLGRVKAVGIDPKVISTKYRDNYFGALNYAQKVMSKEGSLPIYDRDHEIENLVDENDEAHGSQEGSSFLHFDHHMC